MSITGEQVQRGELQGEKLNKVAGLWKGDATDDLVTVEDGDDSLNSQVSKMIEEANEEDEAERPRKPKKTVPKVQVEEIVEGEESEDEPEVEEEERVKIEFEPLPIPELPKERPASVQQAYDHYYMEAVLAVLKNSKIDATPENFKEHMKTMSAYDLQETRDYAKEQATYKTNNYKQQVIDPYIAVDTQRTVIGFINSFAQDFPDVLDYKVQMDELYPELVKKYPGIENNPVSAIPWLYARAKEKNLGKVLRSATNGAKNGSKVALEKGSAQRQKAPGRTDDKEKKSMDKVFATEKSPIDGLWHDN